MRSTAVEAAVRRALAAEGLCSPACTVVAALSGGPDSVALLSALVALRGRHGMRVVAAHLDHRLREESADDAAFCAALCQRLDVPLRTAAVDVRARARREGGGLEQAARRARYAFLRRVKSAAPADAIAVAHTRDDQAETVLLRVLRGAGRTGLGAMRPRARGLVRPLLGLTRQQVLAHLRQRGLAWREDASNADTRLLRNRVRHELIPYLEARFNPAVRATLARAAVALAAEQELLEAMAGELFARAGGRDGAGVALERAVLSAAPPALARLALRRALRAAGGLRGVGSVHVERLLALAGDASASGRRLPLPGGREAAVRFGQLWIGPARAEWGAFEAPLAVPGRVELPDGRVLIARASDGTGPAHDGVVALPDEPLVVRTRRPGDRLRTAGRERSLKSVLLERRVAADLRDRLPVVAAGGRVVWFPGLPPEAGRGAATGARYVALAVQGPEARA